MFNGSNCDQKSQLSGILIEPLNPHELEGWFLINCIYNSGTLNNEYIERIHQMSYSSLSNNGMLQILSFLI